MAGTTPAPKAGPTPTEVTFPRRNTDAGLAPYSIKSETWHPRAAAYPESAGHIPPTTP